MDLVPNASYPRFSRRAAERSDLWKRDPHSATAAYEQREEGATARHVGSTASKANDRTSPGGKGRAEIQARASPAESGEIARLFRIVPPLLEEHVPGRYDDPLTLNGGAIWLVRPDGCLGAVAVRENWRPHVLIKAGIALHMPLSYDLAYRVANLNRELWSGRLYLRSNPQEGIALLLVEDIVFSAALDEASPAGLKDLGWRIGWLMTFAGALTQDMISEFGGQPFGPDDSMFLDI